MADYLLWVCRADGTRLFGYVPRYGMSYSLTTNAVGRFTATLPASVETSAWQIAYTPDLIPTGLPQQRLSADMVVEVWRMSFRSFSPVGGDYQLERTYFLREITRYTDENGRNLIRISGPDLLDLLKRRIVAYNAETSYADKTGLADDVMKAYVRENLGPSATDGARNLDSSYWSVNADTGQGSSITVHASTRGLYDVCRDCADASRTAGTDIYFDIVPVNGMALAFQTFKSQRGVDRSVATGNGQLTLGLNWGSLANPSATDDWDDEANVVYTTGIGSLIDDVTKRTEDTPRRTRTLWSRKEWWENTRDQATTELVPIRAASALAAHRPRLRFVADAVDSDTTQYGRDYRWGDKMTAVYLDNTYTVTAQAVDVRVSEARVNRTTGVVEPPGDSVRIHFEIDE